MYKADFGLYFLFVFMSETDISSSSLDDTILDKENTSSPESSNEDKTEIEHEAPS